jgi:hypothetical protein
VIGIGNRYGFKTSFEAARLTVEGGKLHMEDCRNFNDAEKAREGKTPMEMRQPKYGGAEIYTI